jgi:restriction system protein
MSNDSDLVEWTCPHCGKGWRIPPDRTSRAYCKTCGPDAEWREILARKEAEFAKLSWLQRLSQRSELNRFKASRSEWKRIRAAELTELHRQNIERRAAEERERLARIEAEEERRRRDEEDRLRTEAAIAAEGIERAIREEMMSWEQRLYLEWMARCPNERFLPISGFEKAQREILLRRRIAQTPGWNPSMGFGDPPPIVEPSSLVAGGTELPPLEPIPLLDPEPAPAIAPNPAPTVTVSPPKTRRFRRPALAKRNWADHHQPIDVRGIDRMSGIKFEQWLMELLTKLRYRNVELTKQSGDFGADIVAKLPDCLTVVAIQAKRWAKPVGNKAVYEVLGGMRHYNAAVGIVVSWSGFTRQAVEAAAKKPDVKLWGREKIISLVKEVRVPTPAFDSNRYLEEVLKPFFRRERKRQLSELATLKSQSGSLFREDPFEEMPCHRYRTMPDDFEGPREGIRAYDNRVAHGVGKKPASKSTLKRSRRKNASKRK